MPLSTGAWWKNASKASSPPAEAPMPTMGKPVETVFCTAPSAGLTVATAAFDLALLVTFLATNEFPFYLLPAESCRMLLQLIPEMRVYRYGGMIGYLLASS